jgi:hypothetical protein
MPARPLNLYAAAKVLGEDLGRTAAGRLDLPVIALRLGWVMIPGDPEWQDREGREPPAIAVTMRDAFEVFVRALEAREPRFAVLPVYSRSAAAVKDLGPLKDILGYEPQDDPVADFRKSDGGQLTDRR